MESTTEDEQKNKSPENIPESLSEINSQATEPEANANTQNQEPESMEVHHHTHSHGKKNWKSYIWEFVMLFLAVFCGFLAEYQLEHTIEHQREKEYAVALYDELYADSIVFSQKLQGRLGKERDCDYLVKYLKDSSLTNLPKEFYASYTTVLYLFTSYTFEPKDGVLSQLKGSGSLRYFKSGYMQKLLGDMTVYINNVRDRNDQEYQFFANPVKPFLLKHYDFNWMNELRKMDETAYNINLIAQYRASDKIIKADILNLPSFDRGEAINMVLFYKTMLVSTRTLPMKDYINTNKKLLEELRKEYHLN